MFAPIKKFEMSMNMCSYYTLIKNTMKQKGYPSEGRRKAFQRGWMPPWRAELCLGSLLPLACC